MTGIVTGFEIGKNSNGTRDVVLLQVRISDPKDIQTIELMTPPGDDSIPPAGSRVVILQPSKSWKIAIANQDSITPQAGEGEKRLYSQAGGSEQAYIFIKSDGTIEVNGNSKTAVRFEDLQTALNTFKNSIESAIAGAITGHIHAVVTPPAGPTGPGSGAAPPVAVDISAAQAQEVKLP